MQRELESAFRRARYLVFTPVGELLLRVDQPDARLAELLRSTGTKCAALLTAFNPDGRRQPPFRNRQAQRRLRDGLTRRGHILLSGRNEDPRGLWPAEPSLLVLDLLLEHARQLAARYQQAAFLHVDAGGMPRLIETAAGRSSRFSPSCFPPRRRRYCPLRPAA